MRNFWANERPSSTEDGTETSCSLYSASKTGTEDFNQPKKDFGNFRGLNMDSTAQIRGPGLHIGKMERIGTVTFNSGVTTENESARNRRTELECEVIKLKSENRRQEREKQRYKNDWEETLKKLHSSEDQINALQIKNDQLKYDKQQYQNEVQDKNDLEKDLINCQSRLKQLETENRRLEDENKQDRDKKSLYKSDIQQIMLKLRSCEERYNKLIKCELICCFKKSLIFSSSFDNNHRRFWQD